MYTTQYMPTGGIESHLREFCSNLNLKDVSIDLLVLNSKMLPETKGLFAKVCNHLYLCEQGRSVNRILWLIKTCVRLILIRYDALYTNGQGNSIQLVSRLIRFNNWVHHHHTAGDKADQQGWSVQYVKALHNTDHIIACSRKNADDMKVFLKREVEAIPCFSRQMSSVKTLHQTKKVVRLGYFGRLIPEKGIDIICKLSADSDSNGVEFELWGEGPNYTKSYFDKYLSVHYHGPYLGREGLQTAIESMDGFLLLSSHAEGLPISLLEAMSAGLPWLSTARGGISDIVCDPLATRLISVDASYSDIKRAVLSFANDLKEGCISATKQVEQYQKYFSPSALSKKWISVLGN